MKGKVSIINVLDADIVKNQDIYKDHFPFNKEFG